MGVNSCTSPDSSRDFQPNQFLKVIAEGPVFNADDRHWNNALVVCGGGWGLQRTQAQGALFHEREKDRNENKHM